MVRPPEPLPLNLETSQQALWGIKTVVARTGLSRATVYRYERQGVLPPRRRVGPGRIAWLASDIIRWMETRPKKEFWE